MDRCHGLSLPFWYQAFTWLLHCSHNAIERENDMATYSVTVRDEADVKALEQWADSDERDATHQLNFEIRKMLRQYAKTNAPGQPRTQRRPRAQAA
jgi:hypothetical protein